MTFKNAFLVSVFSWDFIARIIWNINSAASATHTHTGFCWNRRPYFRFVFCEPEQRENFIRKCVLGPLGSLLWPLQMSVHVKVIFTSDTSTSGPKMMDCYFFHYCLLLCSFTIFKFIHFNEILSQQVLDVRLVVLHIMLPVSTEILACDNKAF